ncbi:MAG: fumarate hydratase [Bacilli bacterium]
MRKIRDESIIEAVRNACIDINRYIDTDLEKILQHSKDNESSELARKTLDTILMNAEVAKKHDRILCQDTGMVIVFAEVGYDVSFEGDLYDAINEGVRRGYVDGYLRKSIVKHPINRVNTNDNTPAVIHVKLVNGDKLKLKIASKGGGAENMSALKMLKPSDGVAGIKQFVLDTIFNASGNPCPPVIVGIGIGGNLEKSCLLAKEALFRDINDSSQDPMIKDLEDSLLKDINELGVGPMGFGGDTTALSVKINTYPTHFASLPVAVNLNCHSSREKEVII